MEELVYELQSQVHLTTRGVEIGYLQRGGNTCPYDRILSTEYGSAAMQLAIDEKFGRMVTLLNGKITDVSLDDVAGKDTEIGSKSSNLKLLDLEGDYVKTARRVGICLGD